MRNCSFCKKVSTEDNGAQRGGKQYWHLACIDAHNATRPKGANGLMVFHEVTNRLLGGKGMPNANNKTIAEKLGKTEEWVKSERKRLTAVVVAEATGQPGTVVADEHIFGYSTRVAEDYTPGNITIPIITPRKGSKPTIVVQQHESDEAILYHLFGGDKKEEDWRDFTNPILHIVREYKPKLSKEIVADALGKLVQGQNSYKRRYGITPTLEFITRVRVDKEVLEDVRTIGAKAFQLTKDNQLVEMA